jgi:hypothetical protein
MLLFPLTEVLGGDGHGCDLGSFEFDGREDVAVEVIPLSVFLDEARSFVKLLRFGVQRVGFVLVGGDEFDGATVVGGGAFLGFDDGKTGPVGGLEGLTDGGAIVFFAGFGMLGLDQVGEVLFAVGTVARSHQGFGGGGDRVAVEVGLAAVSVVVLAAAGAQGI